MLLIHTNKKISSCCLHIGEEVQVDVSEVTKISADGQELDRILAWGYPNHGQKHQTYVGDAAQQILLNWS